MQRQLSIKSGHIYVDSCLKIIVVVCLLTLGHIVEYDK